MMREITAVAALGIALLLSACATTANYEKSLNSVLGAHADYLMRSWGVPQRSFQMPGGNTVYVYERSSQYTTPVTVAPGQTTQYTVGNTTYMTMGPSTVSGGAIQYSTCRTEFEADPSGRLVRWRWEGNACTARAGGTTSHGTASSASSPPAPK